MKTLSILPVIIFSFISNCISAQEPVTCTESFISSNWSIVGPLEDNSVSNLGRVISIWVDPDNPDYLLIGTRSSGLWKTTDGGENWTNLTNFQLPACGVSSIAVYDNGTEINTDDIIYVTTVFYGTEINVYNIGLAFSEDNGETWQYDYSMEGEVDFVRTGNIGSPHVYLKPGTDNLFVLTGSKIVIKDLSSDDWTLFKDIDDFSTDGDDYFTEIDFLEGYSDWMVISFAYGTSADAYYTYNNGANWVSIPAPATPSVAGYNFFSLNTSSCVVNPEMLYILFTFNYLEDVAESPEHKTVSYLYRYTVPIGGSISVTEAHDLDGLTSGEFISDNIYESRELFVPGDKPDMGLIRRGQGELFKIDIAPTGSITAYPVTDYWGYNTHADIRAMTYYRSGATSYVYIAHDGGVSRCDDKASLDDIGVEMNDLLWDNINGYGLSITEFNGFGNSELEENKMFASSGDGNSYIINNDALYPDVLQFTNYPNNHDFEKAEVSTTVEIPRKQTPLDRVKLTPLLRS